MGRGFIRGRIIVRRRARRSGAGHAGIITRVAGKRPERHPLARRPHEARRPVAPVTATRAALVNEAVGPPAKLHDGFEVHAECKTAEVDETPQQWFAVVSTVSFDENLGKERAIGPSTLLISQWPVSSS